MISIIKSQRKLRRFLTFDLEWAKGSPHHDGGSLVYKPQVRMAGVFDKEYGFRWYRTIQGFLENELVKRNSGKWFYAHAGGLSDMLFVLEWLVDQESYEVKASFSGSSANIVRVRKKGTRNTWVFVDSLWLLKGKLADIAKTVGMEKGEVESFEDSPLDELIPYNELDCKILYTAIERFQETLLSLGGDLRMTLASCAMALFRRRYLKREIQTSGWVDGKARESYFSSRVEVFRFTMRRSKGYYYDINSSFPYSMTLPCPGNLKWSVPNFRESDLDDNHRIFIGHFRVTVPEQYIPPLPYRHKGSVYFPTGTWDGWFTNIDIRLLLETGGRIEKIYEILHFESHEDLRGFAEDIYKKRLDAAARGNELEKYVYKLLLNSLYGKFGEREEKTSLVLNPSSLECPHFPRHPKNSFTKRPDCMDMLFPGAFLVEDIVDIPHSHVPISTVIVANSRYLLYKLMVPSDTPHYCDTDGFSCEDSNLRTGKGLGQLKLEDTYTKARFVRPKIYNIGDKYKAKGFTLKPDRAKDEKEIESRFLTLLHGGEIEMMRFARVRELYRKGDTTPQERAMKKRLRFDVKEKRDRVGNGDTRPWSVDELENVSS